jgi:hypothetical protein
LIAQRHQQGFEALLAKPWQLTQQRLDVPGWSLLQQGLQAGQVLLLLLGQGLGV